jgi:hypothetical protein
MLRHEKKKNCSKRYCCGYCKEEAPDAVTPAQGYIGIGSQSVKAALRPVVPVEVDPSQPHEAESPESGSYEVAGRSLQPPLLGIHNILGPNQNSHSVHFKYNTGELEV